MPVSSTAQELGRTWAAGPSGVSISGTVTEQYSEVLTTDALAFIAELHRTFDANRRKLIEVREEVQRRLDAGDLPRFLEETKEIRSASWTVAPIPNDLLDRRVEITGPVDRKMIINALNSGANVFMADFEDANSPTWDNCIDGQINLRDAIRRTISYTKSDGTHYRLNAEVATLFVRPRGWHLDEKHVTIDGERVSASLWDFGLYFFHNARELLKRGTGPYFYLPKLESHLEARLWNDVFKFSQDHLGIPHGTIRATVLIENILAAFEMDEILWELKEHSAGLNCGRWDYIFSVIKKFRQRSDFVLPDRRDVGMDQPFLKAYTELLIQTCHRREAHAMGGMAAQVPIKEDSAANAGAIEKVRQDKLREVAAGHDGTWVAHPGLIPVARMVFDQHMQDQNQIHRKREDVQVTEQTLLEMPSGLVTDAGLRHNVSVGVQYLDFWLHGQGCVPINNLMEDAATAEISRSQVWQWLKHGISTSDGTAITADRVRVTIAEEVAKLRGTESGGGDDRALAAKLFEQMMTDATFAEWLTVVAYDYID